MTRAILFVALLGSCVFAMAFQPATSTSESTTILPGAREVIDAAKFPTLQAAIDALPKEGGIVRIPPGKFEITEPLAITRGDVAIEGSGTATLIENKNESGKPAISVRSKKAKEKLWRVRIANLRIIGNAKSGDGIHAFQANEFFLESCTVSYHGRHGVALDDCYEDPRINDSLISYNKKDGLSINKCHDIVVNGNHFEENDNAVVCLDSFNLCMSGNNLDDHLGNGVVIENTYGSIVSSNMIEECQGAAVVLDRDCYGITVSANVIAHDGVGVQLNDAHGCAISANTFTLNRNRAIVVGPESGRITIGANHFSDSYIGEKEKRKEGDQTATGILLDGTQDILISGNMFSGLDTPAIEKTENASLRIRVIGNAFAEVEGKNDSDSK